MTWKTMHIRQLSATATLPRQVTSDLFSAGLVFYELTGKQAFKSAEQISDRAAVFSAKPSELQLTFLLV